MPQKTRPDDSLLNFPVNAGMSPRQGDVLSFSTGTNQWTNTPGTSTGTSVALVEDLTWQVSGTQTRFILSNPVSPNGILLLYNGLAQEYSVHFLVSGTYLNTLFTPATGSTLQAVEMGVFSTGSSQTTFSVQDEGTTQGTATVLNFFGVGVTASVSGTIGGIYVPGGNPLIQEIVPTGSRSVTFSNIPQTYNHLMLKVSARTNHSATTDPVNMFFNGDFLLTNYRRVATSGDGASASSSAADNPTILGVATTAGMASQAGFLSVEIDDYKNTNFDKNVIAETRRRDSATAQVVNLASIWWENTAAINRIDFQASGTFQPGSVFRLYGVP